MSFEGWQVWDVMLRCAGQLRLVPGAAVGIDLNACFGMGAGLGYDPTALAELLPAAEAGMVAGFNERMKSDGR